MDRAAIRAGDPLFDIVDPHTDAITTVSSSTDGVFYMRRVIRFVTAGAPLGRVTGAVPVRKGMLLGPRRTVTERRCAISF
ncbi:hypothetical protein BamMEX5DRAFT_6950 [Burkholderia ambifaria MEX-5]|uniref:Uncharacterized protein n=1 Tax=Burkholderia ambifaria MEX-5 TaxID=396597 RepID=B1TGN4_9BURK|nr:hypothetical protein BamMEX5DRAFT_6950 [Burkholderia ambifaria MEX-5]